MSSLPLKKFCRKGPEFTYFPLTLNLNDHSLYQVAFYVSVFVKLGSKIYTKSFCYSFIWEIYWEISLMWYIEHLF